MKRLRKVTTDVEVAVVGLGGAEEIKEKRGKAAGGPVVVYCDGACTNNQDRKKARAGLGVYWGQDGHSLNVSERLPGELQTSQRAELSAAIRALQLDTVHDINIVTDSEYVCKGVSTWMPKWKTSNWINSSHKPVANQDLWKQLDALLQDNTLRTVTFTWVKGHNGDPGNEAADRLATAGAKLDPVVPAPVAPVVVVATQNQGDVPAPPPTFFE